MRTPADPGGIPAGHLFGLLAHQGGWDEILLVAGPILVIVALIALAQRRARRINQP